jgi:hypothetical protein
MMTESKKRSATLGILSRLRQQGMPEREEKMDSMFDALAGDYELDKEDKEEMPEDDTATTPEPVTSSPENQKKPKLDQDKAKQFMKAFKSVR